MGHNSETSLPDKSAGCEVNDLKQRLIDILAGMEQSITDDATDQWHRCLHTSILESILNILCHTYWLKCLN